MKSRQSGFALATAAAALFSVGLIATPTAQAADGTVKCSGINSCKGKSSCKTAGNGCKGQNSCKGRGWVEASAKECTNKKGTIAKAN